MAVVSLKNKVKSRSMLAGNPQLFSLEYLVVGPGGGGGPNGRGGGAGGEHRTGTQTLFSVTNYTVTIGAGGTWASNLGRTGTSSVLGGASTITSLAGQDGGDPAGGAGQNGGANGGAYGNPDGTAGSNGTASSITGSSVTRVGGGGGGSGGTTTNAAGGTGGGGAGGKSTGDSATRTGTNGTVNTGGGGGGAGNNASPNIGNSSLGGSGIIILKYPIGFSISGGTGLTFTTTTSGSDKITSFTAGTGTISFSS